jgi:hypothetical protein
MMSFGYMLGQQIRETRTAHALGLLTDDTIARLEGIPGWSWNLREAALVA